MHSFARAAVTRYHNQSGLNKTNLLSPGLEAGVGRVVSFCGCEGQSVQASLPASGACGHL